MAFALHKAIPTPGLIRGLCLEGNRNSTTICWTSEWGLNEAVCVKTLWNSKDTIFIVLFPHVSCQCPFSYRFGQHHLCSPGAKLMEARKKCEDSGTSWGYFSYLETVPAPRVTSWFFPFPISEWGAHESRIFTQSVTNSTLYIKRPYLGPGSGLVLGT